MAMKYLMLMALFFSQPTPAEELSIAGKVESPAICSKKVMVWLALDKSSYKERLLLMHTEVPTGGTFKFYVKPGSYEVRASDEIGCEYLKKVTIKEGETYLDIKMVKK
jgi:hypothetical protein